MTDSNALWFPYAQMQNLKAPFKVERAEGVELILKDGRRLVDAMSSWWCVIHGYSNSWLINAAKSQLDRLPHVMLGGLEHEPARRLADKLVAITLEGLNHVFFSDSGSVAVEVALKMAVQYWHNFGKPQKHRFLALKKSYHGDTFGAMSVCDPDDGMHALFSGILVKHLFADAPTPVAVHTEESLAEDERKLEEILSAYNGEIAAFIVEPLLQAAGGFNIYSPDYLRMARRLCEKYDVLLVFDEIATGFGRTGSMFAAEQAGISPDIMTLGKGLTAGYTSHACTLASTEVFESFYGPDGSNAFMHGPTFMANPTACAIALENIAIFADENVIGRIGEIENILRRELARVEGDKVKDVRVLGATGVIETRSAEDLAGAQDFAAERGVWVRPYLNFLYTMPPYAISDEDLLKITTTLCAWLER